MDVYCHGVATMDQNPYITYDENNDDIEIVDNKLVRHKGVTRIQSDKSTPFQIF